MIEGKVFVTGGAGTLGYFLMATAEIQRWDAEFTIFSTDPVKHARLKGYGLPKFNSVIGDIRDATTLYNAMAGHDLVIHAAAVKEIPTGEYNSIDTFEINVTGSLNVANAAVNLGIPRVLGISTDKACHPANNYGATKMIMEKIWQEFSTKNLPTNFHLVRYGNVIESSASVLEKWRRDYKEGRPVQITDPEMTRFWLSPYQAVECAVEALKHKSGQIYVPRMKSLSIGKMAEYILDEGYEIQRIPLRPGEKKHETLVTIEEAPRARSDEFGFVIPPSIADGFPYHLHSNEAFTSENAERFTKEEFMQVLSS